MYLHENNFVYPVWVSSCILATGQLITLKFALWQGQSYYDFWYYLGFFKMWYMLGFC